ncbi:MATE efflux family protein [Nitzschia inconspicua]|uniref:MATE efflux family protein n=1 Tax=Nitzschia inconspicua TaxID=303405 RepID=A0A9K3PJK8_9STRA|nr:MATE efflux family protein [Nitzschia inconspicua]
MTDDHATSNDALTEPLLSSQQERNNNDTTEDAVVLSQLSPATTSNNNNNNNDVKRDVPAASEDVGNTTSSSAPEPLSIQTEIVEMLHLALPLAVSFFCRMGMASTDSAFVGHIHDGQHQPETYLAAAVLSDMVLNICITPPLAFNQVLNGLVSQAMGSGNPAMAGVWLQQSIFWLTVTMLPCLVGLLHVKPILELLGFPSDIAIVAGTYAKYNMIWPIPNGIYQCLRFYFQARGLPRPAMYNNLLFLGINALLNWFFVFGGPTSWKGLGFIGAAISLSISRTMQGVCYYLYMFVYNKHHLGAWPEGGWSFRHHTKERTYEFMKQSLPNIGTLLFQAFASQATTVLVGRLGELSIAASSALSTVTIPWSGTLSATCCTVSGVRVGYHLGRGDGAAAKRASWIVMQFITVVNVIMAVVFLIPYLKDKVINIATDDEGVVALAETLVPAMLVGTYLNLLVSNGTSGVFSGQGRPLIATILSFGLELPLSIGGVAIYILVFHGDLLGVYWFNAISGAVEAAIVLYLIMSSNWTKCADEARERQEASRRSASESGENTADVEDGALSMATTDPESSSDDNEEEAPLTENVDHE